MKLYPLVALSAFCVSATVATSFCPDGTRRLKGLVKWFNESKGFGFITPNDGRKDVFVHYSVIAGDGFKTIAEGQTVMFCIQDGQKGPSAIDVGPV